MTAQATYYDSSPAARFDNLIYPLKTTLLRVRMGLNEFLHPVQHWVLPKRGTHPDGLDIHIPFALK